VTTPTPVVIFLYNRLFDPLIQGNFWMYIKNILDDPDAPYRLHVVTYEDPANPLTPEQEELVAHWQSQGLEWTQLTWHPGMQLSRKGRDVAAGFAAMARLRAKGFRHIVTLGSIAGSYAYLYARVLSMRLFLYQYEPHSDVSVASGMWRKDSAQYRITKRLEDASARFAHVIASGTRFMGEWLGSIGARAKFFRVPTVVNGNKFLFDPAIREEVRAQLGLAPGQPTLFYSGKFGGLYYDREIAEMMAVLLEFEPSLHLLMVTPADDATVVALFDAAGVPADKYSICHSTYDEIERYYFAGDMGLITIPPGPGQEYRSSIKTGEYLCSGMPFLTPAGVSEDYLHATEQDVGVVVPRFEPEAFRAAWPEIERYLTEDRDTLRARCRNFGLEYRGFDALNPIFRAAMAALVKQ